MGIRSILRNGILLVVTVMGGVLALKARSPLPPPSLWLLLIVAAAALSLALIQAFLQGRSALILSPSDLERRQVGASP